MKKKMDQNENFLLHYLYLKSEKSHSEHQNGFQRDIFYLLQHHQLHYFDYSRFHQHFHLSQVHSGPVYVRSQPASKLVTLPRRFTQCMYYIIKENGPGISYCQTIVQRFFSAFQKKYLFFSKNNSQIIIVDYTLNCFYSKLNLARIHLVWLDNYKNGLDYRYETCQIYLCN